MVWSETRKMLNTNYQAQRTLLLNKKAPPHKRPEQPPRTLTSAEAEENAEGSE